MTLTLLLLVLILGLLAYGTFRRPVADTRPLEEFRRQLLDELARLRRDGQADLAAQLQPLAATQAEHGKALAVAKEAQLREQAERLAASFQGLNESLQQALRAARQEQGEQLRGVQEQVQQRLEALQKSNELKLEEMRVTVDEKLHATLEARLGESFKQVSERLEQVQQGLGEMRTLASDVGGLKRALTNVKTRGVLGEAQLGALLEQFLSAGQYETNVRVKKGSLESVEYAVKLPGPAEGETVWLPVDAKFPIEDYQRLMEAFELGDIEGINRCGQALETRVMGQAREIRDKYINPPATTDFALLFLPFEGLFAEVLRRPGLLERVQRECRVTLVGPTTLTAFLNSLQVGFKTLAITKQSAEVWKILGDVKKEFGTFGKALEAVETKLEEASKKLGEVGKRSDMMQKRLAKVESLPEGEAPATLGMDDQAGSASE
jgi:DNA recombination protein RmuC